MSATTATEGGPAAAVRPHGFWYRYRRNTPAVIAAVVLTLIVLASIFAPLIAPHSPTTTDVFNRLSAPTPSNLLGTDMLGRDVLSRLLYAGRVSLFAAVLAVGVAAVLGVPTGLVAGFVGGRVDWVLNRIADVLMTFPTLILAVAVIGVMGPGLTKAMVTLGVVYAPRLFRVVRGATLGVRAETYIEASISIGTRPFTVLRRRVLPNILPPLLVQLSLMLATALLAEAALSLLGLGAQPPTPSWGVELGGAFNQIRSAPDLVWAPGLAIALATLSFNLIGDGLRDSLGREIHRRSR
ncbi:MAG: ABC transporter permease subunit [Streptosporangiales bacterium]|nr:ABC transporter permease subunit [Streptosporangiales bacterium]